MDINEKMVYSSINKTLKQKCVDSPKRIPQEVFEKSDETSDQFNYINKYYMRNMFKLTPAIRRQVKSMFTYAVIHNWVYNESMAKRYFVKISSIQETYNEYWHYSEYLTKVDDYQQYVIYLFEMALKAYEKEKEICTDFELLSSDQQEKHHCPPRMWLKKQKVLSIKNIREHNDSLNSLSEELVIGMPINYKLREKRRAVQKCITNEKNRLINLTKYLKGIRPSGEHKRYFYIDLFKLTDIQSGVHTKHIVRMGTKSILKSMLQEYCSWYNHKNADEIKSYQKEVRKEKQRLAYEKRNQEKLQQKNEKLKLLQQQVHQLMKRGMSLRKIADKLDISYGIARRASKQIEELILKQ